MGKYFLLLIILSPSIGQILPTVPRNVFRLTLEDYSADSEWDLKDQEFDLRGIGKAYFDHTTKNDSGYFSASHDLYHMGDHSIDSVHTVESYLNEFNEAYGTDLPVFGINGYGDFDTTKQIVVPGIFSESRRRKESGRRYRIDYGMSDQVTLTLKVPIVNSLKEKYNVSATADPIDGINDLIIYHETSKAHIDSFFQTSTYAGLSSGRRDTLQSIYDDYYSADGDHSILWALYSQNDPLGNGFIDPRFFSQEIGKDTVDLSDLKNYYFPLERNGSGVNDISIGVTMLLRGSPVWSQMNKGVLYGKLFVSIPFGYTIQSFSDVGSKQFKQLNVGAGVTRWTLGLFGGYTQVKKFRTRLYASLDIEGSASELLNTPISIFSGVHTNPDSIVNRVGNNYKFKEGKWLKSLAGFELQPRSGRTLFKIEFQNISKDQDIFTSKDQYWDSWMKSHKGFDSAWNRWDIRTEIWFLNSNSIKRIGPFSFDIVFGAQFTINSQYTYDCNQLFGGLTTYWQGW